MFKRSSNAADPAGAPADRQSAEPGSAEPARGLAVPGIVMAQGTVRRLAGPVEDPLGGTSVAPDVVQALRRRQGGGTTLPDSIAAPLGTHFGQDFSAVRVHTDGEAGRIARSLQSTAFTHGNDLYFAPGGYRPNTDEGRRVIAHELGHLTAQRTGADRPSGQGLTVGPAVDPAERAADRAADTAMTALRRSTGTGAAEDHVTGESAHPDTGAGAPLRRTAVPDVLRRNPFSKKKKKDDKTDSDAGSGATTRTAGNIGLIRESTAAFTAAKPLNNDYQEAEKQVNAWVTKDQQKKITDIASHGQRSKKDQDKRSLKDLLRAYLLKEFTDIIESRVVTEKTDAGDYPEPTKEERKRIDDKYFPVTLRYRDRNAGLIKLGPYAPETISWMQQEGFDSIIGKSAGELAVEAGGPRIDVRATFIGSAPLGIGQRMHLFIVYTASDGSQFYFRGGPGSDGNTRGDFGDYEPGTVDWDPSAPSVTALKGEAAKLKFDGLIEATSKINGLRVPYSGYDIKLNKGGLGGLEAIISGENCNSTAWTILDRAGVPKKKPSGLHPGWGHVLGDLKGQGQGGAMPRPEGRSGTAAVITGQPTDHVQVYADRAGKEQLETLAGGTPVEHIYLSGGSGSSLVKIKFGSDGKIGWVRPNQVGRPPKPRVAGRRFWVNGKANQMIPFFDDDQQTVYADGQNPIEVLDDDFTMGKAGMIAIRYSDKYLGREVEGKIDAKYLTDQDPGAAPPQPQAIPQVAKKDVDSEEETSESEAESDVQGEQIEVAKGELTSVTTDRAIMLFEADGTQHKYKGIMGGTVRTVNPTGRFTMAGKKKMVEFEIVDPYVKAWMPAADWDRIFGRPYPA
ncbi:MAG TPA: DUF4157 domain-containing protein [Nakamurella sp.]|nr:DUF4157 domain-containing protein [Nakamurella sp.]